jgi:hypothetical protein
MDRGNVKKTQNLVLVFGDQLDSGSAAFDGFNTGKDAILTLTLQKPEGFRAKA